MYFIQKWNQFEGEIKFDRSIVMNISSFSGYPQVIRVRRSHAAMITAVGVINVVHVPGLKLILKNGDSAGFRRKGG